MPLRGKKKERKPGFNDQLGILLNAAGVSDSDEFLASFKGSSIEVKLAWFNEISGIEVSGKKELAAQKSYCEELIKKLPFHAKLPVKKTLLGSDLKTQRALLIEAQENIDIDSILKKDCAEFKAFHIGLQMEWVDFFIEHPGKLPSHVKIETLASIVRNDLDAKLQAISGDPQAQQHLWDSIRFSQKGFVDMIGKDTITQSVKQLQKWSKSGAQHSQAEDATILKEHNSPQRRRGSCHSIGSSHA